MIQELFNEKISWNDISPDNGPRTYLACDEELWPYLLKSFLRESQKPGLIITATIESALEISEAMVTFSDDIDILDYPSLSRSGNYSDQEYIEKLSKRIEALYAIKDSASNKKGLVLISSIASILPLLFTEILEKSKKAIPLKIKDSYDRDLLVKDLVDIGYERVDSVFDKGEFSVKGDRVDIFGISFTKPVSIDYDYDQIAKISSFDISSREVSKKLKEYRILPILDPFRGHDSENKAESLIDYFDKALGKDGYSVSICEPIEAELKLRSEIDVISGLKEINGLDCRFVEARDFLDKISKRKKGLSISSRKIDISSAFYKELEGIKKQKNSLGNVRYFIKNIKTDISSKKDLLIALGDKKRVEKLKDIFTENNISFTTVSNRAKKDFLDSSSVNLLNKKLLYGFESSELSVYGELDIFNSRNIEKTEERSTPWLTDIASGSYIVHKTFGVGKYIATVSRNDNGQKKDYFLIQYAGSDRLYVPIWQADRLHRYVGEGSPRITSLGSRQWDATKRKARSSIKRLAVDLTRLYAERSTRKGHSFLDENNWQKEMEDLFPFDETQDQVRAIDIVRKKMTDDRPMDLLVCGDVGFGKTEVAIRAAFRAILNEKQVLMLVPTTILADQHYNTFNTRYKDYPVNLDVISRFRKKSEQKKIIEDFASGKIDMLIGTHRLLSKDLKANDLGLLIIDEEQRFGVNSKEKIKLLKKEVDVLTLTATPIPRTLHMALTGLRDIVQIDTSPEGRQPIETFVGERDDFIIRMAVEREIEREGQIYYVYNRIRGIQKRKEYLERLIPDSRIAVTHGRMEGSKIETIMEDFIDKKYDILLTTSIIESGMDIGNVNTLIIEDSHRFGISQLYQLRGRVGRTSQKAYAYFLYPEKRMLNHKAFERLKTLSEVTELGSGYKIALKDLELRGAGELLGARQHGYMDAIGFDYYCQMVNEEVSRLKGLEVEKDINIQIELPLSSYIPKSYIKEESKRIATYKALADIKDEEDIKRIRKGLSKRFGKIPPIVENLIKIARIKSGLRALKMEKLLYRNSGFIIGKRVLEDSKARKIDSFRDGVRYDRKTKSIYISDQDKKIDLDLVIKVLSDIILII